MLAWILFLLSAVVIGFLIWYIRSLMNRVLSLAVEFSKLKISLKEYTSHLTYIYSLDMFVGEPIIQDLIKRSKTLITELQESVEIFDAIGGEETDLDDGDDEGTEEETTAEEIVRRN